MACGSVAALSVNFSCRGQRLLRGGGSVAAALAAHGQVALLWDCTWVPAWCACCVLLLVLQQLLGKGLEDLFHIHKSLGTRLHEQQAVVLSMCLCILELHSLLVGQIVLVSHQSDDNAGAGLLLQLLHPVPGLCRSVHIGHVDHSDHLHPPE